MVTNNHRAWVINPAPNFLKSRRLGLEASDPNKSLLSASWSSQSEAHFLFVARHGFLFLVPEQTTLLWISALLLSSTLFCVYLFI